MLTMWTDRIGRTGRFLWSAWSGLAALMLLAAVWQVGHKAYGDFILPSPLATLNAAIVILGDHQAWELTFLTSRRALKGFAVAALAGASLGLAAGYFPAVLRLARPLVTVLLGVPPIAWIVLAMIWFGSTDGTVAMTILVSSSPLIFVSVAEGIMTRDRKLDDMARAFGASAWKRLTTLSLRHVSAHLFPALAVSLGSAFKVAVMAELLANVGGIGGELARSRANLDIAGSLAWVLIAVTALIVIEYGLVHPVRAEFERWRAAAQPWGVKR
ncbi:ABC transporter permease [Brucella thiophenivorans]|uniref:Binding-protein-dependent transport system inner membrane component family protein n=1 Tax=Brucella thiophenivorans TaxID=571255 RepID=A0A256FIT8_9HYPH|nr:ABC transporter permease subunit [Brucella thiophenivorans]OYR14772.1 binding-protein-dependent transport system inner membrane component family protein [Brucella thiophenivorans]